MSAENINILIVDDDQKIGKAMAELVKRMGFKAIWVTKPDDAVNAVKLQSVQLAIVDCMLPKMNGRDLVVKIRPDLGAETPIILVSGVYKDKTYVREALQQTGALNFLTKPFELSTLESAIKENIKSPDMPASKIVPIYEMFTRGQPTARDRIDAINNSDPVNGYDLPWIYSMLLDEKISGHLNIISSDGDVAGVGFSQGKIVQVNLADPSSYLGSLLVENGFITTDDFNEFVASQGKIKRIGEKLINANLVSPHAVDIVVAEQHGIRLSKTVTNSSNQVNFIRADGIREDAVLNRKIFNQFSDDWVCSKISTDWLRAFYVTWMPYTFRKGTDYSETHRALGLYNNAQVRGLLKDLLLPGVTLEQVLTKYEGNEDKVYKALHVLLLCRVVAFGEPQAQARDFGPQIQRLKKLNQELEKQTFFQRLGVSPKGKDTEIKRSYLELAKVLHPDRLDPKAPQELVDLTRDAFRKIGQAHETLLDPKAREKYMRELDSGSAENILESESLFEQGKVLMPKGEFTKANEFFEKAAALIPPSVDLRLHLVWTRLKLPGAERNMEAVQKAKDDLTLIPPEDRHNCLFYFVKGLVQKSLNDMDGAKKNFELALSMDADFIYARRELNVLKSEANARPKDLKVVVGSLFKKRA